MYHESEEFLSQEKPTTMFRIMWRRRGAVLLVGSIVILVHSTDFGSHLEPYTKLLQSKRSIEVIKQPLLQMFFHQTEKNTQPDPWYVTDFSLNEPNWKTSKWNESQPSYILREHDGWIDMWQQISNQLLVYSAYWDNRNWVQDAPVVRIFASSIRKSGWPDELVPELLTAKCLMRYGHNEFGDLVVRIVNATYAKLTKENWSELGYEFKCKDPLGGNESPSDVALRTNKSGESQQHMWIKVHRFQASVIQALDKPTIGLCAKPLSSDLSKIPNIAWQIADFIAYYKVLGISKFTFYDDNAPAAVKRILYDLSHEGVHIQLLPWGVNWKEIRLAWGIYPDNFVTSTQDCFYRNMYKQDYTLVVGVDQFVVPQTNSSLRRMITDLSQAVDDYFADFRFANALFCTNYPSKTVQNLPFPLMSQQKVFRRKISDGYRGAQYMGRTEAVEWAGINAVGKRKILTPVKWVAKNVAFVHQYAASQPPSFQCGNFNEDKHDGFVVEDSQIPVVYGPNVTNLVRGWKKYLNS